VPDALADRLRLAVAEEAQRVDPVTERAAARSETAMPAYANERRNESGKSSNAPSATATVNALPSTVRPAVCTVRTTALSTSRPARSSSR
jgi:hypothetical protein